MIGGTGNDWVVPYTDTFCSFVKVATGLCLQNRSRSTRRMECFLVQNLQNSGIYMANPGMQQHAFDQNAMKVSCLFFLLWLQCYEGDVLIWGLFCTHFPHALHKTHRGQVVSPFFYLFQVFLPLTLGV